MTSKLETGKQGEDIACKYLKQEGYKIIERNYRQKWGEIDIIALDKNKTLTFVEVKTVTGNNPYISAEEQLTQDKLDKVKRTASLYANQYLKNKDSLATWQIDLIAINIVYSKIKIRHYKNVY